MRNRFQRGAAMVFVLCALMATPALASDDTGSPSPPDLPAEACPPPIDPGFSVDYPDRSHDTAFTVAVEDYSHDSGFLVPVWQCEDEPARPTPPPATPPAPGSVDPA